MLNFDLNTEPEEEGGNFLGFEDEINREADTELNGSSSSSKRRRYSIEEKGKAKISDEMEIDNSIGEETLRGIFLIDLCPGSLNLNPVEHNFMDVSISSPDQEIKELEKKEELEKRRKEALLSTMEQVSRRKAETRRQHEIARKFAQRVAHLSEDHDLIEFSCNKEKKILSKDVVDDEEEDLESPFSIAMEMITKRNYSLSVRNKSVFEQEFKWVPKNNKGCDLLKREVPSLLDLSLDVLAKNAEGIVSLELVPDVLRHKLSQVVCDCRKMNAHFVELLARGSPTEIRVKDSSCLVEGELSKIFGSCDTKDLTLLQLDLCGHCLPDYVLSDTLARSSCSLPALVTISLRGAYRLSDIGLRSLAESAPALQSINLSQCSLLTSNGIYNLATCFEFTLRELYIDDCQNIDAMLILPALKKLKYLEVLSVAGIQTVCDDFVIGIVEECGINMKELVLANCVALTDISLKVVGKTCSRLCALDLSYLHNLTDSAIRFLANGCRSIRRLKLCQNGFSDEAIAAFLEASGESLSELSLNNISKIGLNTALSLAKCSRNLLSLDLSWCRKLTDEALGLIVDSSLSLRLLKIFGCTQITNVFLDGHSNSQVQIIGLKMMPVLAHLDLLEPQEAPLRYPLHIFYPN